MANTKKTVATDIDIKKTNINEEPLVEKKSDAKDDLIAKLQSQMLEMQEAFIKMQANQNINTHELVSNEEKIYEIKSRFVNGVSIFSPNKEVVRDIKFNDAATVDEIELNGLLKQPFVREFLENDLLYFNDDSLYQKKRIKKKYNLDDDSFVGFILNNTPSDVIKKINEITKNMKYDPAIHCVFYRIVELCANGKLAAMSWPTRNEIEKIFEFKISDAEMLFRGFKENVV